MDIMKMAHLYGMSAREALSLTPGQVEDLEEHAKEVARAHLHSSEGQKKLAEAKSHIVGK
jgi:hypothetical protein